jgi:hypothetical protein
MGRELQAASASCPPSAAGFSDEASMSLMDGLAMTPWERILANDDMVNFGDSLRAAMEKRNAESR